MRIIRYFSRWRCAAAVSLIIILPVSLTAQEAAVAMLRSSGVGVLVNNSPAPAPIALYRNDLIETQRAAAARIEVAGSSADISQETMVQLAGDELVLDHGSLSVNTSRGLRVRIGCIMVVPVSSAEWSHFEVADADGKVTVWARKNDVYLDSQIEKHPAGQAVRSIKSGPYDCSRRRTKLPG